MKHFFTIVLTVMLCCQVFANEKYTKVSTDDYIELISEYVADINDNIELFTYSEIEFFAGNMMDVYYDGEGNLVKLAVRGRSGLRQDFYLKDSWLVLCVWFDFNEDQETLEEWFYFRDNEIVKWIDTSGEVRDEKPIEAQKDILESLDLFLTRIQ